MNAGPDVERLIASWLDEEAPARAPDRILESAGRVIERTNRRRAAVNWREPMTFSVARLVAAVGLIVIVVGGGGAWLGRSTAGVGGPIATRTSEPSASPNLPRLIEYRAARDAICSADRLVFAPLNDQVDGIFDPTLTADERAPKISALTQIASLIGHEAIDLGGISAPDAVATEHAVDVARHQDVQSLILQAVQLMNEGRLADAKGVDLATDPIARQIEAFEQRWGLRACP